MAGSRRHHEATSRGPSSKKGWGRRVVNWVQGSRSTDPSEALPESEAEGLQSAITEFYRLHQQEPIVCSFYTKVKAGDPTFPDGLVRDGQGWGLSPTIKDDTARATLFRNLAILTSTQGSVFHSTDLGLSASEKLGMKPARKVYELMQSYYNARDSTLNPTDLAWILPIHVKYWRQTRETAQSYRDVGAEAMAEAELIGCLTAGNVPSGTISPIESS